MSLILSNAKTHSSFHTTKGHRKHGDFCRQSTPQPYISLAKKQVNLAPLIRFVFTFSAYSIYGSERKKKKSLFGDERTNKLATITNAEYQKLTDFLQNDERYRHLALPVHIAFHTGMRAGEVCGLTWEDIDFQNQCLYVRRSMYYGTDTCSHVTSHSRKKAVGIFEDAIGR